MFAIVGGYTTPDRDGRGNGINVYNIHTNGGWVRVQTVGDLENPSLFTLNRAQNRLYAVHGGRSQVSAFAIDRASGRLTLLNQVDCQGTNPVDSALDRTERFLVVANYGTGTVAVLPLDTDGTLQPPHQVETLHGTPGPDPKHQASSHPHAVIFDPTGRFVIVPDKGFDRTFFFRFQDGRLTPTEQGFIDSARGAAPRHATFHPALPVLYVNNELDSTVTVFAWDRDSDRVTEKQVTSTIPGGFDGHNTTAEIAASADGAHLYVSNRGQDSVAQFNVDRREGTLTYVGFTPSGGLRPRFFAIGPDQKQVYVANQDSDTIAMFRIEPRAGRLVPTGLRLSVGSPSAISFIGGP